MTDTREAFLNQARFCDEAANKLYIRIMDQPLPSSVTEDGERAPNQLAVGLGALRLHASGLRERAALEFPLRTS